MANGDGGQGGGQGDGGQGGGSASATVPAAGSQGGGAPAAGAGAAGGGAAGGAGFAIPDAYKDRPYLKEVKSTEDVFKMLDGAQTLLGKRPAGIPQENAPKEEWDKFYAQLRPEKPEAYEFKKDEQLAKVLGWDDNLEKGVKSLFHAAGVSKAQALQIQQGYEKLLGEIAKEHVAGKEAADKEFDELGTKLFGAEADKVFATSKALINANAPKEVLAHLDKLDSKSLVLLAGVINSIQKKYIREDQLPDGGQGSGGALTDDQKRDEGRKLMATEAYRNWQHPEHEATVAKVNALYGTKK